MKSKKIISMGMIIVMCITGFFMSGCQNKSDSGTQEIQWLFWDDLDVSTDLITKGYKDVIDRFNRDYQGKYHCTTVSVSLEEYEAKLNALIAANKCPDVFICNPGSDLTEYVVNDVAEDLTDYIKNKNKTWGDNFNSGVFDNLTYDGKIMAVPTNFAAACVYYNKELFAKAGVKPPLTYNQLVAVCKRLQSKGITPITISASTAWCLAMLAGYLCEREGVDIEKIKQGKASWLDAPFINAGNKLVQLSQFFQPTAKSDQNDIATARFYNGQAAMLIQGSWAIGNINGTKPEMEKKCGIFQFPAIPKGGDPKKIMTKTDNLVMSKKTENKDAVVELMKYFTDDVAQRYTAEVGGKIPVTKCDVDYKKAPQQLKDIKKILDAGSVFTGFYDELLGNVEAGDMFNNTMVSIYLKENTVKGGFNEIEKFYKRKIWNEK